MTTASLSGLHSTMESKLKAAGLAAEDARGQRTSLPPGRA